MLSNASKAVAVVGEGQLNCCVALPTATAYNARCSRCRTAWVNASYAYPIPVPNPVLHVSGHVVQSLAISREMSQPEIEMSKSECT